ncbi:MAG: hypothetical protein HQ505_09115 [Nitrosopumilus sp.]|nr:hypothetical protein [Nitrosopumilus sp.]
MILSNPLKSYIFVYGLKIGLPFSVLKGIVEFIDVLKSPREWIARRRVARKILQNSRWRHFFLPEKGVALFSANEIPGLEDASRIAQKVYAERKPENETGKSQRTDYSPFYVLLNNKDVKNYPELVEIATCDALAEILSGYFDSVPLLQNINVWLAKPDVSGMGSQKFHLDKPDVHFVSVFINVFPVSEENGPLTLLPSDISAKVCNGTSYSDIYYFEDGRLEDDDVLKHCNKDDFIEMVGNVGSGAIVDTSTCLHFGSRCKSGERVTLVFRYAPAHKRKGADRQQLPRPDHMSKPQEMLLGAAHAPKA